MLTLPVEIEQMLLKEQKSLEQFERQTVDWPWPLAAPLGHLHRFESSGSGGFAEHVFKFAARTLFDESKDALEFKALRNPDFREVILEKNGEVVLRFAIANGFRNIQNLVQKLKRNKSVYHFVEVMACPSGCLNGGAQIRPEPGTSTRELCQQLEEMYKELPEGQVNAKSDESVFQKMYEVFFGGYQSDKAETLLRTQYHAVEKVNTALNIKW